MDIPERLKGLALYGWVGEDELGSGEVGLKRGIVPAGDIPLVAIVRGKIADDLVQNQLKRLSLNYGKRIYLCRFVLESVEADTAPYGEPLK